MPVCSRPNSSQACSIRSMSDKWIVQKIMRSTTLGVSFYHYAFGRTNVLVHCPVLPVGANQFNPHCLPAREQ
ncbi:hypothetical protein PoB_004369200 [Plakobranchus ocellatus]|uniref:Uncharacterized protein n=1 Tax=Plakobranchus ocellatus TaxID=259542 RepID=A0AAV4BDC3_9GAST|nr:hypothetical protein PoB_004369200 [Plakobranchus ocellatus]